jgi:hypothetical protein
MSMTISILPFTCSFEMWLILNGRRGFIFKNIGKSLYFPCRLFTADFSKRIPLTCHGKKTVKLLLIERDLEGKNSCVIKVACHLPQALPRGFPLIHRVEWNGFCSSVMHHNVDLLQKSIAGLYWVEYWLSETIHYVLYREMHALSLPLHATETWLYRGKWIKWVPPASHWKLMLGDVNRVTYSYITRRFGCWSCFHHQVYKGK